MAFFLVAGAFPFFPWVQLLAFGSDGGAMLQVFLLCPSSLQIEQAIVSIVISEKFEGRTIWWVNNQTQKALSTSKYNSDILKNQF